MKAGLIAGVTAAIATNSLEAITVAKQTDPDRCIKSNPDKQQSQKDFYYVMAHYCRFIQKF